MHSLIQEMIHYRNSLEAGGECEESVVSRYEEKIQRSDRESKGGV